MPGSRFRSAVMLCALPLLGAACAMANGDRRRVLNVLDHNLTPSSATGRWLLSPVALPVGIVAGVADAVVVHPVSQLDDAWLDTVDLLWVSHGDSPLRRAVLIPVAALATPLVFAGDWFGRAVFDIDDHGGDS
ncbi:MAG: hypothetical protein H6835_05015 [Planctomycetes bacterium]|nr:hypothetical protein [Planctomycetota bacterium]